MTPFLTAALIDDGTVSLVSLRLKQSRFSIKHHRIAAIHQISWRKYKTQLCLIIPSQFVHLKTLTDAPQEAPQRAAAFQDTQTLPTLGTQQVSGHESAIEKLTEQLPIAPKVLEPAPQAWVRCTNYLLPSLSRYAVSQDPITEWIILCKEQQRYILLRVKHGILVSLHSLARLEAVRFDHACAMILSYLDNHEDSQVKQQLLGSDTLWFNIGTTSALFKHITPLLFGAALRGFFPWRG